ncbi:hypothetical protein [Alkalimarinus alittae]|uniref:Uncharacterized protein n=1 Tax=Alkalimarinus alittae TaxID=2961619 RepID=A0ABY6N5V3_9ALTE|nr:hypothetical protein [Alkalimarinus alittae]UZE97471.1 hypothetical protein NKI27_06930 [Alkalimarinus alittae]
MNSHFAFLPSFKTRLAADAKGNNRSQLTLSYDLKISASPGASSAAIGSDIAITANLKGPGDVVSVSPDQIARIEPQQGLRGFEPNYFPFVEFVDVDFPWRFSLDNGVSRRNRPWLSLLALKPDEFDFIDQGMGPLPRIRIHSASQSLPNLNDAWATAHSQVNLAEQGSNDPVGVLAEDEARGFSRLMCFRKLDPQVAYYLFLVPNYQCGVLAGMGAGNVLDAGSASAWDSNSGDAVTLPFYLQSRFNTNALEDLEVLLRRLTAFKADGVDEAGATTKISAANPGYYLGYQKRGAQFELQGALKQPGSLVEQYNTDTVLASKMVNTLKERISGELEDHDDEDPLVSFPAYGHHFRHETRVVESRARQNKWFDRINLDLKMRQVAALGAETVRKNQEEFSKICWRQYKDVLEANKRLARLRLAKELTGKLVQKHFVKLPSDVSLVLSEPLLPYIVDSKGKAMLDNIRNNGIPSSFASRNLRRISAKRPVRQTTSNNNRELKTIPSPQIPGDMAASKISTISPGILNTAIKRRQSILSHKGVKGALGRSLKNILGENSFNGAVRPRTLVTPISQFSSHEYVKEISNTLYALPEAKARFTVSGLTDIERKKVAPVYRSPVVPLPLANYLTAFSKDSLLPGVSHLPNNTVAIFDENRMFIESFMVGANHAMNDELRWREYPTDMRGTIFSRFWDRGLLPSDESGNDIKPIHQWGGLLGKNDTAKASSTENALVVVIRGDVIRKLGLPLVMLNEAKNTTWKQDDSPRHEPAFFGKLGQDVAYYGFDVPRDRVLSDTQKDKTFFVIYEPVGQLRFGLDVGSAQVRIERQAYSTLPLPFPVAALGRSYNQVKAKPLAPALAPSSHPQKWSDLSWRHVQPLTGSNYLRFNKNIHISGEADLWGGNKTSASIARAMWQKPIAAVLPLKRIL